MTTCLLSQQLLFYMTPDLLRARPTAALTRVQVWNFE